VTSRRPIDQRNEEADDSLIAVARSPTTAYKGSDAVTPQKMMMRVSSWLWKVLKLAVIMSVHRLQHRSLPSVDYGSMGIIYIYEIRKKLATICLFMPSSVRSDVDVDVDLWLEKGCEISSSSDKLTDLDDLSVRLTSVPSDGSGRID